LGTRRLHSRPFIIIIRWVPASQYLEAFWPGVLSLIGDQEAALKTLHNYHQVDFSLPVEKPSGLVSSTQDSRHFISTTKGTQDMKDIL
jgi:hypothetical protein